MMRLSRYASRRRPVAWCLVWLVPCLLSTAEATQRALQVVAPTGQAVGVYTASYALVLGASRYTNGWPGLPGVAHDIAAVRIALETHGFDVTVVQDPTAPMLHETFHTFITRYGLVPEHRLLIYFAGHGHTAKQSYGEDMGYIVPVDAPNPHQDAHGFFATAMDMQQIEVYARRIQAKHVLFLFDSCFSGSIFSLSRAVPEHISYKTNNPVRQFITSGSAEEQVPDTSIFRQQFLAALSGEGDVNGDGDVTGTELGEFLQGAVVNYSKGAQHPQYGKIRNPHLDKGDFVFKVERAGPASPPHAAAAESTDTGRDALPPTLPAAGIPVPEVRGRLLPQAQQLLVTQQLAFEQAGTRAVPLVALQTIVEQEPKPGTRVPPGTVVRLIVGTQEALARELMAQATATRHHLAQRDPEERGLYWWALLRRKGRAEGLQQSVLLALEAVQRFPGPETEEALHRGLALLTQPVQRLEHDGYVYSVAFHPDGTSVATASADHTARLWEVPGGQQVRRLMHDGAVHTVAFSPDGRLLATASADTSARLWDVASGRQVRRLGHDGAVHTVAFSPDGRWLATTGMDTLVRLWDVSSGQQGMPLAHADQVRFVAFSADSTLLATASGALSTPARSNTALIWHVSSAQVVARVAHEKGIQSMAFHPQGTALATASDDATVRLWDPHSGQEFHRLSHKSSVSAVRFSPEGQYVATVSRDATARLWAIDNGREVLRVLHDDSVQAVAFRPDSTSFVTGSQDATARMWAVRNGLEIARLGQQQPVRIVVFSPNGKYVVTAGDYQHVDVWEVSPDDLVSAACIRLPRNLTPEEWRQYLRDEPYRKTCADLP